jgi:hypothetical protein
MEKLTLSVSRHVIERAKAHAKARGTSVSKMVEAMLDMAARSGPAAAADSVPPAPILTKLRGSMRRGSIDDYRKHIEKKYT